MVHVRFDFLYTDTQLPQHDKDRESFRLRIGIVAIAVFPGQVRFENTALVVVEQGLFFDSEQLGELPGREIGFVFFHSACASILQ